MTTTQLPELETEEARQAVTESVLALLVRWHIPEVKRIELLGIEDLEEVTRTGILPDDKVVMERARDMLAIGRALDKLLEDEGADWWVTSPQETFGGFSPLLIMLGGLSGIRRIRKFVEAALGEQ
jgi:hypothetical protein